MKLKHPHNTRDQSPAGRPPAPTRPSLPPREPTAPHSPAAATRHRRYPSLAGDHTPGIPCDRWSAPRGAFASFDGNLPKGSWVRVIALLAIIAIMAVLAATS